MIPLLLTEQGIVRQVRGIAISSQLFCEIEPVLDTLALHAGASLAVWATSSTGCILG